MSVTKRGPAVTVPTLSVLRRSSTSTQRVWLFLHEACSSFVSQMLRVVQENNEFWGVEQRMTTAQHKWSPPTASRGSFSSPGSGLWKYRMEVLLLLHMAASGPMLHWLVCNMQRRNWMTRWARVIKTDGYLHLFANSHGTAMTDVFENAFPCASEQNFSWAITYHVYP